MVIKSSRSSSVYMFLVNSLICCSLDSALLFRSSGKNNKIKTSRNVLKRLQLRTVSTYYD